MSRSNRRVLLPEAKRALENFKYEVANELGLVDKVHSKGWENMTSRECGLMGGTMVRKMVHQAEEDLVKKR